MIVDKRISIVRLLRVIWKQLLMIAFVAIVTVWPLIHFQHFEYAIDRSIPLVVGTAIAIFLGFRTNSAYERWWEARQVWGQILNDSLNIARLCRDFSAVTPSQEADEPTSDEVKARDFVKTICYRQSAWAQVYNRQLKGLKPVGEVDHLINKSEQAVASEAPDSAMLLLSMQSQTVAGAFHDGLIDTYQQNEIQRILSSLTNSMGACARIRNTNFPTHYSFFTKVFIWIFLVLMGFSLPTYQGFDITHPDEAAEVQADVAQSVGFTEPSEFTQTASQKKTSAVKIKAKKKANRHIAAFVAIPAIILIGWVFFMVDGIGDYMQSPFENNRNVIPMATLSRSIEINLRMLLGETEFPDPLQPVEGVLW